MLVNKSFPKTKIFGICFIISLVVANFWFWQHYYVEAIEASRSQGFQAGFQAGYKEGFNNGNLTGYNQGYNKGYSIGFKEGNETGYEAGYEIGFQAGFSITGYNIRDPTFKEVLQFLEHDQTDKNEYSENYTCWNFAADVKNNAFKTGYRCGLVYIEFEFSAHAIVCFNTTDKGLIFVEPQDDKIVKVEIGIDYWTDNGYNVIVFDETIIRYGIVW